MADLYGIKLSYYGICMESNSFKPGRELQHYHALTILLISKIYDLVWAVMNLGWAREYVQLSFVQFVYLQIKR